MYTQQVVVVFFAKLPDYWIRKIIDISLLFNRNVSRKICEFVFQILFTQLLINFASEMLWYERRYYMVETL